MINNFQADKKLKISEYISEEKSGTADEWLESKLFMLTLSGTTMSEEQQIATLLGAVKGDLQKQLYSELQRKRTSESKLTLSDFREILIKVTKKSSSEYSRILDKYFSRNISIKYKR